MGVRAPEGRAPEEWPVRPAGASLASSVLLALILWPLLLANGRPIPSGDTRPTERVAASLVEHASLALDAYPDVEPPFAREESGHRVSIYPVLSAVAAAPVFGLSRLVFDLDETGLALAGKVAASLFSALAGGILFLLVSRRWTESEALVTAFVFVFGTSVWSTSQALWQHPLAVLSLSVALLWMQSAEADPRWAGRVGLPLGLALAARHADVALVAALGAGVALRWPRRLPSLLLHGLPGVAFLLAYQWHYFGSPLRHGFSGSLGRFSETWGIGHYGLLLSPAKGLLVFTPVVIIAAVGLVAAARRGEAPFALTLGAAVLAHWLLVGRWSEWHGGESFGPRMMTDVLPLLLVFLPEGFALWPRLGPVLAAVSIGVQGLGAFGYDNRWERVYQRPPLPDHAELWQWSEGPIPVLLRDRVLILAAPDVRERRAFIREHRLVPFGPRGSRIGFEGDRLALGGSEATFEDVHLEAGARIHNGSLRLNRRWDALFLRVTAEARVRRLELRIDGHGTGTLYVGERSFSSEAPRWSTYPVKGTLRVRHAYRYLDSAGPDLLVTIGKSPGDFAITSVALVAPDEPENSIQAP